MPVSAVFQISQQTAGGEGQEIPQPKKNIQVQWRSEEMMERQEKTDEGFKSFSFQTQAMIDVHHYKETVLCIVQKTAADDSNWR